MRKTILGIPKGLEYIGVYTGVPPVLGREYIGFYKARYPCSTLFPLLIWGLLVKLEY